MQLQTILNRVQRHKSFVYGKVQLVKDAEQKQTVIEVEVRPRANGRPICSACGRRAPGYDRQREPRRFVFVPLWQMAVIFLYRMRRVNCPRCGVKVEQVPWCDGKNSLTTAYRWFLAGWARRLSWKEVAVIFRTSWESVFRSVRHAVSWGLVHRDLSGIEAIGVDEVQWKRGHKYLTLVYQIDAGLKRLLWIGVDRTEESLRGFFRTLTDPVRTGIQFVCSDMWKSYLQVIREQIGQAVHVLDRFHIMKNLGEAIDTVRREEASRLVQDGYEPVLKRSRWCLLKRPENLTDKQTVKLSELLQYNLRTVRAYLLREDFQRFWKYQSVSWAGKFLDEWSTRAMRSRLEPIKKVARSLREHRELILNWFRARGTISAGTVEGLNNKVKLTTRKSYGFRTEEAIQLTLYHNLGRLPEPEFTHRFC